MVTINPAIADARCKALDSIEDELKRLLWTCPEDQRAGLTAARELLNQHRTAANEHHSRQIAAYNRQVEAEDRAIANA